MPKSAVIDTSVLVSAFLFRESVPGQVIELADVPPRGARAMGGGAPRERGRLARMLWRCEPLRFPAMLQPATLPAGTAWTRPKQSPGAVAGRAQVEEMGAALPVLCGRDARAPGSAFIPRRWRRRRREDDRSFRAPLSGDGGHIDYRGGALRLRHRLTVFAQALDVKLDCVAHLPDSLFPGSSGCDAARQVGNVGCIVARLLFDHDSVLHLSFATLRRFPALLHPPPPSPPTAPRPVPGRCGWPSPACRAGSRACAGCV